MTSAAYKLEVGGPGRVAAADLELVVTATRDILQKRGRILPTECAKELLDRARPSRSPLHHLFEWNDSVAAERYRLQQARQIIASVIFRFDDRPDSPVRGIPIVTYDGKRSYELMPKVLSNKEATEQLVAQAKVEALAWHRRWEHLAAVAELAPAFRAIGKLKRQ